MHLTSCWVQMEAQRVYTKEILVILQYVCKSMGNIGAISGPKAVPFTLSTVLKCCEKARALIA
jgi:hypothetical protein